MAKISAATVKSLRDKTGAGMMACKKALVEANGDAELAMDNLRKAGIAKAEKKAGRTAKEGRVVICLKDNTASMVELLCETDFVAKTDKFSDFANDVATEVVEKMTGNDDISKQVADAKKDIVTEMIANIGENMQLRRTARWETDGKFASYIHAGGKIGVLIDIDGEISDEDMLSLGMHIAAFNPAYITPEEVPAELVTKEKEIFAAQMEGKPAAIIEKILEGKINKWYKEICLLKQGWILDDKKSVADVISNVKINRFLRWQVGEDL